MTDFDNLEKVFADTRAWVYYEGADESETIGVYRRCECGRYLTKGELLMNMDGEVKLKNWSCKIHKEQQPFFDRY